MEDIVVFLGLKVFNCDISCIFSCSTNAHVTFVNIEIVNIDIFKLDQTKLSKSEMSVSILFNIKFTVKVLNKKCIIFKSFGYIVGSKFASKSSDRSR